MQVRSRSFCAFRGLMDAPRHPAAKHRHKTVRYCRGSPHRSRYPKGQGTLEEQKEGGCGGHCEHRPSGSCGGLYHVPGVGSPCWDLGAEGAPSYLIGDLASERHPCSWKETHRLKSESLPRELGPPPECSLLRLQGLGGVRQPQATVPLCSAVSMSSARVDTWPSGQVFLSWGHQPGGQDVPGAGSRVQIFELLVGAHADAAPILVTSHTEQDEGYLPENRLRLTATPALLLDGIYVCVCVEGCGGSILCVPWRWRDSVFWEQNSHPGKKIHLPFMRTLPREERRWSPDTPGASVLL